MTTLEGVPVRELDTPSRARIDVTGAPSIRAAYSRSSCFPTRCGAFLLTPLVFSDLDAGKLSCSEAAAPGWPASQYSTFVWPTKPAWKHHGGAAEFWPQRPGQI